MQWVLKEKLLIVVAGALVLFYSCYKLFVSPETWMDEGIIIQSADALLHTGKIALPVAPGVFESVWYLSTNFPVTAPLAAAFAVFGMSLTVARLVILPFLLAFFILAYFYAKREFTSVALWAGFGLLIFYGPLYGNGRNVLGEVPGLVWILASLLALSSGEVSKQRAILAGLFAGLAVATKPIFVLFIPALLIPLLLRWKTLRLKEVFGWGVAATALPIVVWLCMLQGSASPAQILSMYANPHHVELGAAVLANLKRFITEIQPLYFLGALGVWTASYVLRRVRKESIQLSEEVLFLFSWLILLAFIRTTGYYRYFFPAQVFALLYLPQSLFILVNTVRKNWMSCAYIFLAILLAYQAYETTFRSWTAVHYSSTRTESLTELMTRIPANENLFLYQTPEVYSFTGGKSVYLYEKIIPGVTHGTQNLPLLEDGVVPHVIVPSDVYEAEATTTFGRYQRTETVDSYAVLTRVP